MSSYCPFCSCEGIGSDLCYLSVMNSEYLNATNNQQLKPSFLQRYILSIYYAYLDTFSHNNRVYEQTLQWWASKVIRFRFDSIVKSDSIRIRSDFIMKSHSIQIRFKCTKVIRFGFDSISWWKVIRFGFDSKYVASLRRWVKYRNYSWHMNKGNKYLTHYPWICFHQWI